MVKIYTGKGDDGTTGLWYGGRVPKSDGRPEAYGAIDEAASALGLARTAAEPGSELYDEILRIQNELFVAAALDAVQTERVDAAFFMRATPVEQVQEVAEAGESMPPKSTYFFPKIPTGLVFNPLE